MTPAPGTHVSASVRLEACIGEGGMGSVWLARDVASGRELAVKLVAAELVADETVRRRFAREAELGRSIASPHVVRTHEHGTLPDGTPYLVMDLCRGESLRAKLLRVGRLDAAEAVGVVEQMASALEAAHALGVVHRDVKPENVFLIAPEGTVKVLDFGIAKREGAEERMLTQAGVALGTPEYMSPEQLLFPDRLESGIDVWAMAVVAYEALTGRRPFAGDTPGEIFAALCSGHAPPPSALGMPATLDAFFARAFATDPAERPRSPRALAAELRASCEPLLGAPSRARHGAVTLATQLSPLAGTQAAGHARPGAASSGLAPGSVTRLALASADTVAVPTPRVPSPAAPWAPAPTPSPAPAPTRVTVVAPAASRAASARRILGVTAGLVLAGAIAAVTVAAVGGRGGGAGPRARSSAGPSAAPSSGPGAASAAPVALPNGSASIGAFWAKVCSELVSCRLYGLCTASGETCLIAKERDCEVPCRTRGSCGLVPGQCKPRDAADCARSELCRRGGCELQGGTCLPRTEEACASSAMCVENGQCGAIATGRGTYLCLATSPEGCAAARACKAQGMCDLVNGACAPSDPRHCAESEFCGLAGFCSLTTAPVARCLAASDADCAGSVFCTQLGRCTARAGKCEAR